MGKAACQNEISGKTFASSGPAASLLKGETSYNVRESPKVLATKPLWKHTGGLVNSLGYGNNVRNEKCHTLKWAIRG